MRTLNLSESVLIRAQLQPSSSEKHLKFINSSLHSLIPFHSKKQQQKSKHFTRNSNLLSSRYPRQWSQNSNANNEQLEHYLETSSTNRHSIVTFFLNHPELRFLDQKNSKAISKQMFIRHDFGATNKTDTPISSRSKDGLSTFSKREDAAVSNMSFHSLLKFSMLFGLLTLQGSQQAMAGSEFAAGLQSIPYLGDLGDISTGFASAFLLIFFSELGDKTFFIAALLAARNSAAVVFIGTFGALATMTIISVVLGRTFHYVDDILPFRLGETDLPIDDIAAVCLLVYFGVSTLIDAASSDGMKTEEEQKEAELAVSDFSGNGAGILAAANTIISTFILVFVAEWGDKSFFSTIALAAASSPLGVIGGATAGHAGATLLAVLGGSLLGNFLSEKIISYVGGILFLVFAAVTVIEIAS